MMTFSEAVKSGQKFRHVSMQEKDWLHVKHTGKGGYVFFFDSGIEWHVRPQLVEEPQWVLKEPEVKIIKIEMWATTYPGGSVTKTKKLYRSEKEAEDSFSETMKAKYPGRCLVFPAVIREIEE